MSEPDWKAMCITLALAMKPVLDDTASWPDEQRAKQALSDIDQHIARWIRQQAEQQTQQQAKG